MSGVANGTGQAPRRAKEIVGVMVTAMRNGRLVAAGAGVAALGFLGAALWWRRHPSACPYGLRFTTEIPHPFITRSRLRSILSPLPGERVLEVGPGAGYYSIDLARALAPNGTLELFDLQQEMLDHAMRKAQREGLSNLVSTQGDARALPYPDDTFDAACLNVTLGEVPDQDAALGELRRVLKPGGRLVVGEIIVDFHYVPFGALRERAAAHGLLLDRRLGGPLGYYALFRSDSR